MSLSIAIGSAAILTAFVAGTPGRLSSQTEQGVVATPNASQQKKSGSQSSPNVTGEFKSVTIVSALKEIARRARIEIAINANSPSLQNTVNLSFVNTPVLEAIHRAIDNTDLEVRTTDDRAVYIIGNKSSSTESIGSSGSTQNIYYIAGQVTDAESKRGISGVTVSVAGMAKSATTNAKGEFKVQGLPSGNHALSFRILGYVSTNRSVQIKGKSVDSIHVLLKPSATSLSEVVTTATGTQRRIEVPTDIVKINADQIRERAPVRNIVDMLEAAQVPGVLVTRAGGDPGAPSRIRIRGIGSISQSNDPVMILDGVWIDASSNGPSRLDDIDPASIETIEIIRGPSAATLFGQDAANGVIVITTKKGSAGPTRWTASYKRDWGQTYGKQPLFYYGVGRAPTSTTTGSCPVVSVVNYLCQQDTVFVFDPNHQLLSREGVESNNSYTVQMDGGVPSVTYSVTLSTGNTIGVRRVSDVDKIRARVLGYKIESEFATPSELRRNNITTRFTFNPRSNLSLSMTLNGTQSNLKDNSFVGDWRRFSSLLSGIGGNKIGDFRLDTTFGYLGGATITASEKPVKTTTGIISSSVQYTPLGRYVINANFGAEKINTNNVEFGRKTECQIDLVCFDTLGTRSQKSDSRSVYTVRLNASTNLNLGPVGRFLEIRPSIGGDYRKTDQSTFSISKNEIPVGDRSINLGTLLSSSNIEIENAIAGWFLNSTIGLFKRVYFDVGLRQDIGSAITSSKNAVYPKIGGSWLVSDESFWRENPLINSFRLRSAIGHAAVQPDPNDILGKFVHGAGYVDGNLVKSVDLSSTGNNRLFPERSVELELGFDLDMLNDRLNFVGTYAHKNNRNTLVVRSLPPSFGTNGTPRKENIASVRNRNFELSGTGRVIETNSVLLVLNYALTLSDNRVVTLGDGVMPFGTNEDRVVAGYPLASSWGKAVLGYRDINGDGLLAQNEVVLTDSSVYLGWSQPRNRSSYGFSLTMYNQFVFDSRFAYQSKYVQNYRPDSRYGSEDVNASLDEQAIAIIPGINGKRPISDLRWNTASITYHLPKNILQRFGGRSVSVSLQGRDLGLWTNYIGRDPGVNSSLTGDSFGDNGKIPPRPRLYVLDFKIGL